MLALFHGIPVVSLVEIPFCIDRSRSYLLGQQSFQKRNSSLYRKYASVISRLAESLVRSGQFRLEDRILDVAIALERMYELARLERCVFLKK